MNKTNHRNSAKLFSEIKIGDKAEFNVLIDDTLHESFSKLSGDYSPIHCDNSFCKNTKFGNKIGYGFMLMGFLSRLYGEYLPGGSSICIKQTANFVKPFFIGNKIKITAEVVSKIESTKFIDIKTEMHNDAGECIFRGIGTVQVMFDDLPKPLYENDGQIIYSSDILNAMQSVGIKEGDILFVHSDLAVFGKLLTTNRNLFLQDIMNALKKAVGNKGTLILPTFTYSFCNNEIYDVENSRSTVGILSDFFRQQTDVVRTTHPIFSVALLGNKKQELMKIDKTSFGENSIFGKIHKIKGKLLFLGAPFQSCTFIHYIEKMHGIPYRFVKKFKGKIKCEGKEYEDEYEYFVRFLDKNVNTNLSKLEKHLLNKGMMKKAKLGNGEILLIDSDVLYREGLKLLDQDIYFFLKEVPNL